MTRATPKKRVYLKHSEHAHPQTKQARQQCRRIYEKTGKPWDGTEIPFEQMTRGEKSAATKKRRQAEATQAEGVEALLDASNPMLAEAEASVALNKGEGGAVTSKGPPNRTTLRDASGRFNQATLDRWCLVIDQMDEARSYITTNGIELLGATLVTSLGGQKFVAEFDGDEWVVTAE